MMTEELLKKLKAQDSDAYNYIYDKYSWELHNYLRQKCPDKEMAAEAFRQTMNGFCQELEKREETELLEVMLHMYADTVCTQLQNRARMPQAEPEPAMQEMQEKVPLEPETAEPEGKGKNAASAVFRVLLMLLLGIVLVAAVWVILGQVMRMGLIPGFRFDWGYSWFNRNIAPWFLGF